MTNDETLSRPCSSQIRIIIIWPCNRPFRTTGGLPGTSQSYLRPYGPGAASHPLLSMWREATEGLVMRLKFALLPLACLIGTLGLHRSVFAETDTPKDAKTLQTIRVEATAESTSSAAKLPLTLRETPQSVTVMTRERLEDQNLQSLDDVLNNTPGVYSYAWDTERVLFTARGFLIDNLLYDGVPAEGNFSTHSVDETLDTALYDRIEIVRGATGLMTGAGNPAASINLHRKHADSSEFASILGLMVGSWDDRRVDIDL